MRPMHQNFVTYLCLAASLLAATSAQEYNATAFDYAKLDTGGVVSCLNDNGVSAGEIVMPGKGQYDNLRSGRNSRFDKKPTVIVAAKSAKSVVAAVKCGIKTGLPVVPMSGGHSYAGTSTTGGILVNFFDFKAITSYDKGSGVVTWQPGKKQGDLMVSLLQQSGGKHAFAGGVCASVATGGFLLVGGIGFTMRTWGMANDGLESFDIVTGTGQLITAKKGSDLYWARYMCGPQLGIVTSFTYKAKNIPGKITMLEVSYGSKGPLRQMMKVFSSWIPEKAPEEVNCVLKLSAGSGGTLQCKVFMSKGETDARFWKIVDKMAPEGKIKTYKEGSYADALSHFAYTDVGGNSLNDIKNDHIPSLGKREKELMRSRIATDPLPDKVLDFLSDHFTNGRSIPKKGAFKALGGQVSKGDSSFPYRDANIVMYFQQKFEGDGGSVFNAFDKMESVFDSAGVSKGRYCGYQDPTKDWAGRTWSKNLGKMKSLKEKYDPYSIFKTGMDL